MAINAPSKLRVMVDANVLIAGTVWPRWPYEVLRHAIAGDFQLVLSSVVIEEAQRRITLSFPDTASRFADVLALSSYEAVPTPTDEEIAARPGLVRDAKDIHVALSAMNAHVDYLISSDKDLTAPNEPIHQHLKILLPGTFLRVHLGWTSEQLEAIRNRTWKDV